MTMYLDISLANMLLVVALAGACYFWKRAEDEADEMYDDMGRMLNLLYEKRAIINRTEDGYSVEQIK